MVGSIKLLTSLIQNGRVLANFYFLAESSGLEPHPNERTRRFPGVSNTPISLLSNWRRAEYSKLIPMVNIRTLGLANQSGTPVQFTLRNL